MTQYTGHSAKHGGLQGHSVGEFYPIVTLVYGDGSYGLRLGGYELRFVVREQAFSLRETLHLTYELQGWEEALEYFKDAGASRIIPRW